MDLIGPVFGSGWLLVLLLAELVTVFGKSSRNPRGGLRKKYTEYIIKSRAIPAKGNFRYFQYFFKKSIEKIISQPTYFCKFCSYEISLLLSSR